MEMERRGGKLVPVSKTKPSNRTRYDYGGSWTTTRDIPTGKFCLYAYSPYIGTTWARQWKVPQDEKLPRWIKRVIRELEDQAKEISDLAAEAERQRELDRQRREAQFKEWKREEEKRRQAKDLADSHAELLKVIDDWAKIKRLERFFTEIELAVENIDVEEHKIVCERLKLA